MEAEANLRIPRAALLATLLLLGLPGASAWTIVHSDHCAGLPLAPERCDALVALLRPPCLSVVVVTPTQTIESSADLPGCDWRNEMHATFETDRVTGRIWIPQVDTSAPAPGPVALPSTPAIPTARAGFGIAFDVRLAPCAAPLFRVDGEAHAGADPFAPVAAPAGADASLSPACSAALSLADPATAQPSAALALYHSLVEALLGIQPPAVEPAIVPSIDGGGASGEISGEVSTSAPPDADAQTHVDAPDLPDVALAVFEPAAEEASPAALDEVPPAAEAPAEVVTAHATSSQDPGRWAPLPPPPASREPIAPLPRAAAPAAVPVDAQAAQVAQPAPPVDVAGVAGMAVASLLMREALSLYSRITRERVLEHPVRRRVHEAVRARPAAGACDVARELGVDVGTVRYHLETLRRNGAIGRVATVHGPIFHAVERRDEALRAAPEPLPQRILALVASEPGVNTSELARRLAVSKRAVQNHVLDLLAAGRLAHRRDAGARRLYPGAEGFI